MSKFVAGKEVDQEIMFCENELSMCSYVSWAKHAGQNHRIKMCNRFLENVSKANPGDRSLEGVRLRPLACWD